MKLDDEEEEDEVEEVEEVEEEEEDENSASDSINTGVSEKVKFHLLHVLNSK